MAKSKQSYPTLLYDANGGFVGSVDYDEDMAAPENRNRVVESGGKNYLWNQRNARFEEAGDTVKLGTAQLPKEEKQPGPVNS